MGEKGWPKKELEERESEVNEVCRAAMAAIFSAPTSLSFAVAVTEQE